MNQKPTDQAIADAVNAYMQANPYAPRKQIANAVGASRERIGRLHREGLVANWPDPLPRRAAIARIRAACAEMNDEFFPEALRDLLPDFSLEQIKVGLAHMRKNQEIESRLVMRHGRNTHIYSPGVRAASPRADTRQDIGNQQAAERLGEALGMPAVKPINAMAARYVFVG